ncbi:type IV toxin-antitoxin system AbiEi family antitoxin domain-containing protein [Nocardioides daejeonensis]|uniref:type IV toxin-antitoxin system AbiEi family antitoxin domain-containing protein n=1 Tax=Nocardioides daejeonensis TaxID=1046556 RepID=UPI000D74D63B|nr:type IV toxin-antitoxin system AbiEi family antitoxin domain-containing protein [Nocardioides daejeonensis]
MDGWVDLLRRQAGVIGRDQLLAAAVAPHAIRRMVRRRELTPVSRGLYLDHTGAPTRRQREWMAVRALWPAVLSHQSALDFEATGTGPIHVAVDSRRRVNRVEGVRSHYVTSIDTRAQWHLSPPRMRIEEAALDLADAARRDLDVIAALADAVGSRRTTAERIARALEGRSRISGRAFIAGVLEDVAAGTCSVLEHRYLTQIERAHGLPAARRQVRDTAPGTIYRDALIEEFGLVIELDGHLVHSDRRQREVDLGRDLRSAARGLITVRLGWGHVIEETCGTATALADLLATRGWAGHLLRCPSCP